MEGSWWWAGIWEPPSRTQKFEYFTVIVGCIPCNEARKLVSTSVKAHLGRLRHFKAPLQSHEVHTCQDAPKTNYSTHRAHKHGLRKVCPGAQLLPLLQHAEVHCGDAEAHQKSHIRTERQSLRFGHATKDHIPLWLVAANPLGVGNLICPPNTLGYIDNFLFF